jgi:hypothetical protein
MEELYVFSLILSFVILLGNWLYCNYFTDKTESYTLATATTVVSMSLGLFCILMIPIDVFLVSVKDESFTNLLIDRRNLQNIYFGKCSLTSVLYALVLFFAFILIPYSYFYGNSEIEEFNCQNEVLERSCRAFKKSVCIKP